MDEHRRLLTAKAQDLTPCGRSGLFTPEGIMTTSTDESSWVVPASIPFDELKAKDLEECVYWLLDAMGAQDIEWRVGGVGGGAADGGRDIAAKILVPAEAGELAPQTWWFECKGRKRTVESEAVKYAAQNALAYAYVDAVVVVTNARFSNPTVEWVKSWNDSHAKPQLKLWDRTHLEKLISRQPSVALRLFAESLSLAGRLEVMRSRFWNRIEFAPVRVLVDIWERRDELEIDGLARFALIANEFANRSIERRPWGTIATTEELLSTLQTALANVYYLFERVMRAGVNQHPIFRSFTYLLLLALQKTTLEQVARTIEVFLVEREGKVLPDSFVEIFLGPILGNIKDELAEVCVPDCSRVHLLHSGDKTSEGELIDRYWHRFEPMPLENADDRVFWLESNDAQCAVGFQVNEELRCPLISLDTKVSNLRETLGIAKHILSARLSQARERRYQKEKASGRRIP
jgi:hypothetical protein